MHTIYNWEVGCYDFDSIQYFFITSYSKVQQI